MSWTMLYAKVASGNNTCKQVFSQGPINNSKLKAKTCIASFLQHLTQAECRQSEADDTWIGSFSSAASWYHNQQGASSATRSGSARATGFAGICQRLPEHNSPIQLSTEVSSRLDKQCILWCLTTTIAATCRQTHQLKAVQHTLSQLSNKD